MPRASISGGLQLPARLTFIAPAPDSARVVSAGGALNLQWTAGTGDTLVALTVTRPDQPGRALVAELTDDGSFTVPASELDRFRGGRAFITLTRFEERYPRLPTGPSLVTRMFSGATIDVQLD